MPIAISTAPGAITFANIVDRVDDIPAVAWQKSQDVLNKSTPYAITIELNTGPKTTLDFERGEAQIRETIQRTANFWNGFSQSKYISVLAYNGTDEPWAEKKWLEIAASRQYDESQRNVQDVIRGNCQENAAPGQFTGPILECRGSNTGSILDSEDSAMQLGMSGATEDLYITSGALVAHEYTHSVQAGNWIGSPTCTNANGRCFRSGMSNSGFSPCWLFEGLPNSTSRLIVADSLAAYQRLRAGLPYGWGPTTVTDYSQASLHDYLYKQSPSTCYQNGALYVLGYSIGALATEALIAIGGPQAVMALYALGADGLEFTDAFERVYGVSWSQASLVLSKVLAKEYAAAGPPPQ